jgi:acetyl esterase/lipase
VRLYGRRDATCALLWLHGGGFLAGDLDMPEADMVATELAARADALVASVDYRLAQGGVRYPVPLDDAHAAWRWFAGEMKPGVRVALGGASAGAALALSTALRERDTAGQRADLLLLAYPFVHFPSPALDDDMVAELATLPPAIRLTAHDAEFMVRNYVGRITGIPTDALPGAASLHGLPAVHLILCEYDDLRASGELLARQLADSSVNVETYLARGMPHGHLNRTPALPETDRSLDFLATALRT